MARKKHLQGIDEGDMEYIDEKMRGDSRIDSLVSGIIHYDYKVSIKCKNQKQKEYANSS